MTWKLLDARQAVRDRSGGDCEARTPLCSGIAVHVHHKRGRKGPDPHHPDLLLDCCSSCHQPGIHRYVDWSYRHGFLLKRVSDQEPWGPHLGCDFDCDIDHNGGAA